MHKFFCCFARILKPDCLCDSRHYCVLEGARDGSRRLVVAEAGICRVFDHRPIVLVRAWKHAARVQPRELPVKVADIVWSVDIRLELRSDFSSVKGVEIDVQEEWMRFDLDDAIEAESRFRIFVEKSLKKIAGVAGNSVWQGRHSLGADSLVELVVRRPRRLRPRKLANDHFVENDAERPPVDWETVWVVVKNFWSQVFRSSAKSPCDLIVPAKFLAKAEIRDFYVSISVQ